MNHRKNTQCALNLISTKVVTFFLCWLTLTAACSGTFRADNSSTPQSCPPESGPSCVTIENTLMLNFEFALPTLSRVYIQNTQYVIVDLQGANNNAENPGDPLLPIQTTTTLIPKGKRVDHIEIATSQKMLLSTDALVLPKQRSVPFSCLEPLSFIQNVDVYDSNDPYPKQPAVSQGIYLWRGYQIDVETLCPFEYIPQDRLLFFYPTISLTLYLSDITSDSSGFSSYRGTSLDENELHTQTEHAFSSSLSTYNEKQHYPDREGLIDLLIITTPELKQGFYPLAAAHNREGIHTIIKTVGRENTDIPLGYDRNDTCQNIREYIRTVYKKWNLSYVLLGGDMNLVPAPYFYFGIAYGGGETFGPTDLYYACLDGSFNSDNDTYWGESTDGQDIPGGNRDVDLLAEVYVGRASVGDLTEVRHFVNKTLSYTSRFQSPKLHAVEENYYKKVLMVGDDEWCTEWMEELLDECDIYGYKTNGIPTDKYDVEKLYANLTYTWPVQDLIDQINSGIHILNHVGHSYYDYNMRLTPENVSNLTNTKLSFIYSMGCMAGGFDDPEGYDSMAEWFTIKTESGAFAGIWNSREGWAGYLGSIAYDRQFWNAIFREDISAISKAIQHAKEDNIGFIQSDQEMRWCCYTLIYFGDPTIQLRHRPLLAFAEGPSDASLNTPVQFNGSVSGDRREPLRWRWDFGDGTISNDQNPLHVFETPGVYSIQLTLQDRTHQINSSTIVVTVHPPLVWVDDDFTNQTLGWGRDHFNTIQEGIDMVNASGTVLVSPGTYNTQLMINKPLTLRGDRCMSIINDTGEQSCTVTVTADRVTICGFTIQGKLLKTALSMGYSHWCLIQENTILDAYQGISFSFNDNNTISNNILQNSAWGIYLYRSSENNISNNTISSPSAQMNRGISIQDFCRQNKVSNNVISDSTQYGISLSNAENNTISHNTLTTNNDGILIGSNNNTIARNIIRENMRYGIFVFTNSRYNLISGNTIEDNNDSGIYMNSQSNLNTITDNVLGDNTAYGIYVKSSNNRIYNNIFENIHNAFATSSNNIWDLGPIIGGNSWSDWETNPGYPTTYIISQNNVDHYPVH